MIKKLDKHVPVSSYHKTFNRNLSAKNKKFFFVSNFISNLLTNKINFSKKKNLLEEKHLYLSSKKNLWKSLIYYTSTVKKNPLKLFEFLIISKKLNMRRILVKFLNIFIKKKLDFSFLWKTLIISESDTITLNFSLDFIFLYGIRYTGNIIFFLKEYLNTKLTSFRSYSFSLKADDFLKIKYLEKIITVICCNFFKLNSTAFSKFVLSTLGKIFWVFPHFLIPFKELTEVIKSRFFSFHNFIHFVTCIFVPYFPILNSFCLFSIFIELKFYPSFFPKNNYSGLKSRFNKSGFKKNILFHSSNEKEKFILPLKIFYLYY